MSPAAAATRARSPRPRPPPAGARRKERSSDAPQLGVGLLRRTEVAHQTDEPPPRHRSVEPRPARFDADEEKRRSCDQLSRSPPRVPPRIVVLLQEPAMVATIGVRLAHRHTVADRRREVGMKYANRRLVGDRESRGEPSQEVFALIRRPAHRPVRLRAGAKRLIPGPYRLDERATHEQCEGDRTAKDVVTGYRARRSIPPKLSRLTRLIARDAGER